MNEGAPRGSARAEARQLSFTYEVYPSEQDLVEEEQELLGQARRAMDYSHSPYSNFTVGAAIRTSHSIITGSNQENAAYGSTICAERSALLAAGSQGFGRDVQQIAIIGTSREFQTTEPITPCGSCRQVIKEYEDLTGKPITLLMSGEVGPVYRMIGIDTLLPFGFGPKDLGIDLNNDIKNV